MTLQTLTRIRFATRPVVLLTLVIPVVLSGCVAASKPAADKPAPLAFPAPPEQARFYLERSVLGGGAVEEKTDELKLKQFLTGATATEQAGFGKPFDVAVHRGRVFVTDTVLRGVMALDFAQHRWFQIGDKGDEGDLNKPLGIAVDKSGRVYVCDGSIKTVMVYDRDGNFLRSIGDKSTFNRPSGVEVNAQGTRLFVVDTGGVDNPDHRIQVFDATTGKLLRSIGTRGSANGELNLPRDVKLGRDGLLYVTDGGNFRIQVFSQDGKFIRTWGKPGARLGQFSRPKGISIDPQGNVYAVDAAFGNYQIFNPKGQLLLFVGRRSTIPGPGKYMLPAGIDVDEDGRVYMVDQFFRKVDIYRPAALRENQGFLAGQPGS